MRPDQVYASFVIRLWYTDQREPVAGTTEPLRGQITHVQSDHAGAIQDLEEIGPFIQAHLLDSHSPAATDESTITVEDNRETSKEENVISNPGGKDGN